MWWWDHHDSFFRYFLFLGLRGPSKVCRVGTRWMQNLIPHPMSSPDRNLSKNTGRYVKNTNKKVVFFFSSSKINKYYFNFLNIILLIFLGGPFWVEISSNAWLTLDLCFHFVIYTASLLPFDLCSLFHEFFLHHTVDTILEVFSSVMHVMGK